MRGAVCMPKTIPNKGQEPHQVQSVGGTPCENLIMDFTEMPQARGCKYLLLFFCTFSEWVETFPTQTEKTQKVARCLLRNHLSIRNTCLYWIRQWAGLCGQGATVGG
jgi:hypothetical protein